MLLTDIRWWTGWTGTEVDRALRTIGSDVAEVDLDGSTGVMLAADLEDDAAEREPAAPWVGLLPALDPTVMGWAERAWYLGPHGAALFDRSGNAGPTIWADGRIVGGWAQRPGGSVGIRLLEDVGSEAAAAIDEAAVRLGGLIGGVRVTPRFRTPLERELSES